MPDFEIAKRENGGFGGVVKSYRHAGTLEAFKKALSVFYPTEYEKALEFFNKAVADGNEASGTFDGKSFLVAPTPTSGVFIVIDSNTRW